MGDIKLGNSTVNKIYYGNSEVTGLYLGSNKIYPNVVLPYKYWWRIRGTTSPIAVDFSNSFGPTNGTINLVGGNGNGKICASQDSKYVFYTNVTASNTIRISSDYGASFSSSNLTGNFDSIACSDSGQYVIASSSVEVAISVDYGATWSLIVLNIAYPSIVVVSRSGQYMYIKSLKYSSGYRFYSHDYGATWVLAGRATRTYGVTCSGDGRYVYYWGVYSSFDVSSDYGVTLTSKSVSNSRGACFACSDDGKYVYFQANEGIYRSSDYGETWSVYSMTLSIVTGGISGSCSYDGKHVVMRISATQFAISDDYGVTFRLENYVCNDNGLWVSRM